MKEVKLELGEGLDFHLRAMRGELGDRLESSSSVLIYPSGIFSPAYDKNNGPESSGERIIIALRKSVMRCGEPALSARSPRNLTDSCELSIQVVRASNPLPSISPSISPEALLPN